MAFSEYTINAVWNMADPIPGYDSNIWRRDETGAAIRRDLYGKLVKYGWEIDHRIPTSWGGTDDLSNLRPLNWESNRAKGNRYRV